jgi:hypothetical protein
LLPTVGTKQQPLGQSSSRAPTVGRARTKKQTTESESEEVCFYHYLTAGRYWYPPNKAIIRPV